MSELPSGTVTFLFTDIEGSTGALEEMGSERYAEALADHRSILRQAFETHGGVEVDTQGDASFAAFPTAPAALEAAAQVTKELALAPLRARIGIHTGTPLLTDEGYVGADVHRAARISTVGHGGQVLVSAVTAALVGTGDLRDLGEHRLKDLSEPVRLFQLTAPGLPDDFPALRTLSHDQHNLPVQLTSFVGRKDELTRVGELLGEVRLATLAGVGGSGKTRLALQAAAAVVENHPDGVWLVELAGLTDPERIADEVAKVLGIREGEGSGGIFGGRGSRPARERLVEYLDDKELLVVLDNCEHLLDAAGRLADLLLRSCPGVRILATSRERLGIGGEALFQVPSLRLPDSSEEDTDAILLFAERARAVLPSFALGPETRPHVERICRRLDGIPLAIELAAARVKVMGVDQLADRLNDRFRLLTGGSRTALPRQQTLEATVDWSYQLLTEEERTLLRRLSVFRGGFTLEAAEAVCPGRGVEETQVLELLSHLVDKSLVATVEGPAGPARYRLLETLRAYARDKLIEPEGAEGARRHRAWFLALAEEAFGHLEAPDQQAWLDRLDAEHDNLRAALDWSLAAGEGAEAARLGAALTWYWIKRGYFAEGRGQLERVIEEAGPLGAEHRAKLLLGVGTLTLDQGDPESAVPYLEEGLLLAQEAGDRFTEARCREILGVAVMVTGHWERAVTLLSKALELWRGLDVLPHVAQCLLLLGNLARFRGGFGRARVLYEEAREVAARSRDTWTQAWATNSLGIAARNEGDLETARTRHERALELLDGLGDPRGMALALTCLGIVARLQSDYDEAVKLHHEALELERQTGISTATTFMFLGELARLQGDLERAGHLLGQSLEEHREEGDLRGTVLALERVAGWMGEAADLERATRLFGATRRLLEEHGLKIAPPELPFHEADLEAIREKLGSDRFEELLSKGEQMTFDEALADALGSTKDGA